MVATNKDLLTVYACVVQNQFLGITNRTLTLSLKHTQRIRAWEKGGGYNKGMENKVNTLLLCTARQIKNMKHLLKNVANSNYQNLVVSNFIWKLIKVNKKVCLKSYDHWPHVKVKNVKPYLFMAPLHLWLMVVRIYYISRLSWIRCNCV